MSRRRDVVLVTGTGLEHGHVARVLSDRGLVRAVVRVDPARGSFPRRAARASRQFGPGGCVARVALKAALAASGESARRQREFQAILGESPVVTADVPVHDVEGLTSEGTGRLFRSLRPEIICIYGTSVVPAEMLTIARRVTINIHTGISPRYRGADCAFWPLFHEEPEWLGATVHKCTSNIDGGPIYAVTRARLRGDEGVAGVFARCVDAGAKLAVDVLEALDSIEPTPQNLGEGTEYRAAMRGWAAELAVRRNLRRGLLRALPATQSSGAGGAAPSRDRL